MAKETLPKSLEEFVAAEAKTEEKAPPPASEPVAETKKPTEDSPTAEAEQKGSRVDEVVAPSTVEVTIQQSAPFKEESNVVADLQETEKKALQELKQLIQASLAKTNSTPPPLPPPVVPKAEEPKTEETKPEEATVEEGPKDEEPPPSEPPKVEELVGPAVPQKSKAEEPVALVVAGASASKAEDSTPPVAPEAPKLEVAAAAPEETPKAKEVAEVTSLLVDEDGTKTVEAIEETVVPVNILPPAAKELTPKADTEAEKDKEAVVVAEAPASEQPPLPPPAEELIWGVPLLGNEKSDTVLLKFLRARDFKVKDALSMIKNAVIWRKQFEIESLLEEDLAVSELEKVVFYHGHDKEGHPVCYNVFGEFQDQELYSKAFGDDEKREKFLRWRIQCLEKGIRQQLDFSPHGVCTMVQVTDLKNVPGPGKKELRQATKKALSLLQDNYPEFVAKQVFINVPWWYLAYNRMMSPFFTQRTKSKFVFAGPSRSAETLFRYVAPEQVPVQYGGLSKDNDPDFATSDAVEEATIKPSSKHIIELPVSEKTILVWELRVLGWDVTYSAEFVPSAEEAYTVLVQKPRKLVAADEPYVKNSFKVGEPGKIIITIDNATTKKKKLLFRSKTKSAAEST
ncbi:hypothetical protein HPP92_011654 [Vanilla planifolia]|uniref:Patellin-3 n=1 Tax=Vanilla planifolia TaxID=51239 RepID=A0A835R8W1_VANPL|nr:hypothetical protein HPP92_011654 [Vanilla planifolia]